MCIHQDNFNQLMTIYPLLGQQEEKSVLEIPVQPMPAAITVKHRGASYVLIEIAFLCPSNGRLVPDHKMRVRVNWYLRQAVPESIWFQGRGTQHTREPKVGVNQQIVNVIARRLGDWLTTLTATSAVAH